MRPRKRTNSGLIIKLFHKQTIIDIFRMPVYQRDKVRDASPYRLMELLTRYIQTNKPL